MDIKGGTREHAFRMLQCLTVANRPLSVAELAELLAFDSGFDEEKGGIPELNSNWRWEDHEQAVLSTCSSLITIVPASANGSPVVQFSHFSVKEFLMDRLATSTKDISRYHIVIEDANTLIARACLSVLLRDFCDKNGAGTAPLLAEYAAEHWVAHAQVENVASRIREGMEYLFGPDRPYFSVWVKSYNVDNRDRDLGTIDPQFRAKIQPGRAPLYCAAFCGFHEIIEHLVLKYPRYSNAICGPLGTTLHSASQSGQVQVVCSLLKRGVDVDARGLEDVSSMQLASYSGHLNVVRYLLDYGADPNFQDGNHRTALAHAAAGGRLEIVRVLLEHHMDVDSRDRFGRTSMHIAIIRCLSKGDHPQIIQLLLEHGANPNAQDNKRERHCIWCRHCGICSYHRGSSLHASC